MAVKRSDIARAAQSVREAQSLATAAAAALSRALPPLEKAVPQPFKGASDPAETGPLPPPCEHRRLHRPGVPGRIDSDPELQAFIRARADRLTYDQLVAAIRDHFPPDRHVSRSTVHKWWSEQMAPPASHPE